MIQSDESERNAQRKLQVMGMDPSFELLADIEQLALERLTRLQQLNGYDAIFMYSIMTLLGRSNDGPQMVDAEFGLPIYALDDWADQNNVLVVMKCHLRKQTRDATVGAGSQAWAVSDIWAICKADTADDSCDTHLILKCLKGRFCKEGTA